MQIKQIMTKDVVTSSPDETIQHAAEKMKSIDVGMLPVIENGNLLGTITDRDITVRVVALGLDPTKAQVRNTMSQGVVFAYEDEDVHKTAQRMMENQIRRLPIVNRSKKLVGIVALGDLATETKDKKMTAQVLERVSEPPKAERFGTE